MRDFFLRRLPDHMVGAIKKFCAAVNSHPSRKEREMKKFTMRDFIVKAIHEKLERAYGCSWRAHARPADPVPVEEEVKRETTPEI